MTDIEISSGHDKGDLDYRTKKMHLDHGWLGKLVGGSANAPMNVAGFCALALLATGIASLFTEMKLPARDVWSIVGPLFTLVVGYIFGKNSAE